MIVSRMTQKYVFFFYRQGILPEKSMMTVVMMMFVAVPCAKILWPVNEFALVDAFGKPIDDDCRNPSSHYIYGIMCPDIYGGKAQNHVKRQKHPCQRPRHAAHEKQNDGGHSHMRAREGRDGKLALLCCLDQRLEESAARLCVSQLGMKTEPVAYIGEVACHCLLHAYLGKVELRPCRLQEEIDSVVEHE